VSARSAFLVICIFGIVGEILSVKKAANNAAFSKA
jgi:hypothetical protein